MQWLLTAIIITIIVVLSLCAPKAAAETADQRDARMAWWREARFGMFIHWGLYSIAAGEIDGVPVSGLSSWQLHTSKLPLDRYTPLKERWNPVKFDANAWVQVAKDAGMKYIIVTSKHHEGFCLFDSALTDFDVATTQSKRDIMKELSKACRREGMRLGWYHSILDWHHPDYLPRRPGDERPTEGADLDRYVAYMKDQLRELVTNYGHIDVLWFDGEWDATWTHERGKDLYDYVRGLQPDILINNRVDKGRQGMQGLTKEGDFAGDFGTPEQEIPPEGLSGVDWETCMTMNDTWGFRKDDHNWKSTTTLIRMLADTASKGGNFLLNIGPKPDGTIPEASIERLAIMGQWLSVNAESIYGTQAGPFKRPLPWGRCTVKPLPGGGHRLYCIVFDWPEDAVVVLPGLRSAPTKAFLLADSERMVLQTSQDAAGLAVYVPNSSPDPHAGVVALDIAGAVKVD